VRAREAIFSPLSLLNRQKDCPEFAAMVKRPIEES
jgi:hypothetical protein